MRKNEQSVVISQKKSIHLRLLEKTRPNIAEMKRYIRKPKKRRRSLTSLWCSWYSVHVSDRIVDDQGAEDPYHEGHDAPKNGR